MKSSYHKLSFENRERLANLLNLSSKDSLIASLFLTMFQEPKEETQEDLEFSSEMAKMLLEEYQKTKQLMSKLEVSPKRVHHRSIQEIMKKKVEKIGRFHSYKGSFENCTSCLKILSESSKDKALSVPMVRTILVSGNSIRKMTYKSRTSVISVDNLKSEIRLLQSSPSETNRLALAVKPLGESSEFYYIGEDKKVFQRIYNRHLKGEDVIVQEFVVPLTSSKFRVHYSKETLRIFKGNLTQSNSQDSSIPFIYKTWLEKQRNRIHSNRGKNDNETITKVLKLLVRISDFYAAIAQELIDSKKGRDGNSLYSFFYKKKHLFKKKKREHLTRNRAFQNPKLIVKFTQKCEISENFSSLYMDFFKDFIKNLKQVVSAHSKGEKYLVEFSGDFIETQESFMMIMPHMLRMDNNQGLSPPLLTIKQHTRSNTFFLNNKFQKKIRCIGSYCNLIKLINLEIDIYLISQYPVMKELLKIQSELKNDPLVSILEKDKTVQYKVLNRYIWEDRSDPNSVQMKIDSLPDTLMNQLGISFSSNKTRSVDPLRNKIPLWNFDLVPVCYVCYKVYKRKRLNKDNTIFSDFYESNRKQTLPEIKQSKSTGLIPKKTLKIQEKTHQLDISADKKELKPILKKNKVLTDTEHAWKIINRYSKKLDLFRSYKQGLSDAFNFTHS